MPMTIVGIMLIEFVEIYSFVVYKDIKYNIIYNTTCKPMATSPLSIVWQFCETITNDKILSTTKFDGLGLE